MKKYLILAIAGLVSFASVASAQSYTFNNDLRLGSTGPDVVALQTWLISSGYDIPLISSGVQQKGYYGFQTMAAVIKLQQALGYPAYGFFGPETRAWINSHGNAINNGGGNGSNGAGPLRIISPNGGEVLQRGTTKTITWTSPYYFRATTADLKITQKYICTTQVCPMIAYAPLTIAQNIPINQNAYNWVVGYANNFMSASQTLPDGQYTIQICESGTSNCDTSDSAFTITSSNVQTSNSAPVINGVDSPTSLSVNQTGTWTVHASDPLDGTLSYNVNWGDSGVCSNLYTCSASIPAVSYQNSTFTHSYSTAGTYTVTFTVTNSSGRSATVTSTVTVSNTQTSAGPLQLISPNGGEVWQKNTVHTITWSSPYYFAAAYADIKVTQSAPACPANMGCGWDPVLYTIATNIPINQNSYSWNVGSTLGLNSSCGALCVMNPQSVATVLPDGLYTVQICQTGTNTCDSSNSSFTITSSPVTNTSQITVLSPNGGEQWQANSTHQISWSFYNNTNPYAQVDLYLGTNVYPPCVAIYPAPASCAPTFQTSYVLDKNIAYNATYNWIVGTDINNNVIPAGQYVVEVCPAGTTTNCDTSASPFTIVGTAYPATNYNYNQGSSYSTGYVQCPTGYICTPQSSSY